jgi:hypothetical protein
MCRLLKIGLLALMALQNGRCRMGPQLMLIAMILLSVIAGFGWATKDQRYLWSAKNRATEQRVRDRLGEPTRVEDGPAQHTVWIYERQEYVEGGNNAWTMVGSWWTDTYALEFDDQKVLRDWSHSAKKIE